MKSGRFFKCTTFALALLLSLVLVGQAAFAGVLPDIQGHWAAEEVEKAVGQGYVKGYPDGLFRPDRAVSRAEFVSLVGGAFQLEDSSYQVNFKDVRDSDWFYGRLASMVKAAYVAGYPDGTFRPQQSITRQEAASILSKFLQVPDASVELPFYDAAQIGVWAQSGVAKMVQNGIIKGRPDNTFAPLLPITRAESVVMINQVVAFLKVDLPEKPPVDGEEGKPALSVEPLDQEKSVGTTVKITATYLDGKGAGVKGEKVQFTVSRDGKVELEKELLSDQNGQAILEYRGPNKSTTDKVRVAAGDLETTATVKWVTAGGGGGGGRGGGGKKPIPVPTPIDELVEYLQALYSYLDDSDWSALDAAQGELQDLNEVKLNSIVKPVVDPLKSEAVAALDLYEGGAQAFFGDAVREAALITYTSDQSQLKGQLESYSIQFGPGLSALFELTEAKGTTMEDLCGLFLDVKKEVPNVLSEDDVKKLVREPYSYFEQNINNWFEKALLNAVERKHPQFKGSLAALGLTTDDLFETRSLLTQEIDPDQNAEIALLKAVVRGGAVGEGPKSVAVGEEARFGLKILNIPVEKLVNWKSSDQSVATMGGGDKPGNYLTAVAPGRTTIIAYKNDPITEWVWKIEVQVQ